MTLAMTTASDFPRQVDGIIYMESPPPSALWLPDRRQMLPKPSWLIGCSGTEPSFANRPLAGALSRAMAHAGWMVPPVIEPGASSRQQLVIQSQVCMPSICTTASKHSIWAAEPQPGLLTWAAKFGSCLLFTIQAPMWPGGRRHAHAS